MSPTSYFSLQLSRFIAVYAIVGMYSRVKDREVPENEIFSILSLRVKTVIYRTLEQ